MLKYRSLQPNVIEREMNATDKDVTGLLWYQWVGKEGPIAQWKSKCLLPAESLAFLSRAGKGLWWKLQGQSIYAPNWSNGFRQQIGGDTYLWVPICSSSFHSMSWKRKWREDEIFMEWRRVLNYNTVENVRSRGCEELAPCGVRGTSICHAASGIRKSCAFL